MIDVGPVARNWVAVSLPKNARYWQPNIPVDNSGLIIQGSIKNDFILHVEITVADTMGILCQDNDGSNKDRLMFPDSNHKTSWSPMRGNH